MTSTNSEGKPVTHWLIGLTEFLLVLAAMFLILSWRRLPPEVPWLYSLPWGEAQLIPKLWFGLGLVVAAAINLINLAISRRFQRGDTVVATVIGSASLLLTVMYLAAFFRVVSIIT